MRIAIIGAGFTGLTAALRLQQQGHNIVIFEKERQPGGLASGYKEKEWEWTLDEYYHHWFTNDKYVLKLAEEIGHKTLTRCPKTSVYVDKEIFQFDSPLNILLFPKLSFYNKIRMAITAGIFRYDPFWKPLERINAVKFLPKSMGKRAYKMIWEPQFINKFGKYADEVSLAWFWARITKRTQSLVYPVGGFGEFTKSLTQKITQIGGKFYFNTEVFSIKEENDQVTLGFKMSEKEKQYMAFDKVIVTLPAQTFIKIAGQMPTDYKSSLAKLKALGATNLVLRLSKQFFPNDTYWLSICEKESPVMAIVEHTNFIDKAHYNNEYIVYLGNYLASDHENFVKSKEELLKHYDPLLKKINPNYRQHIIGYKLFKSPFAQPIVGPNYSQIIPPIRTPWKNIYLANMEQVYPWDRGTNYAVQLGQNVADICQRDN